MTIFINFDVETTGPSPSNNDLLSVGAVADVAVADNLTDLVRVPGIGEFSCNLHARGPDEPGNNWDPDTKAWWHKEENAEALRLTLQGPRREPDEFASLFMNWLAVLIDKASDMMTTAGRESWKQHQKAAADPCPIVFVAYPIVFDMSWLRHVLFTYEYDRAKALGWSLFSGWDILTHKAVLQQRVPYLTGGQNNLPHHKEIMEPFWKPQHVAINDARAQAALFKHLIKASQEVHDAYVFQKARQGAFAPVNIPALRPQVVEAAGTTRDL